MPAVLLVLSLYVLQSSDPPVLLLTKDKVYAAHRWTVNARGGIDLLIPDAARGTMPVSVADPVMLRADLPPEPETCQVHVALRAGEVLCGEMQSGASPGTIQLQTAYGGMLTFPLDTLTAIRFVRSEDVSTTEAPPYIVLQNGDVLAGEIRQVGMKTITIESPFGEVPIETDRAAAVVFATTSEQDDTIRAARIRCELADGQRWFLDGLAPSQDNDHVRVTRGNQHIDVAVRSVRQIVFPGWMAKPVLTVAPTHVTTVPYLAGVPLPPVPESARPCAIGARTYDRCRSVAPRTMLNYPVPAGAIFLVGYVGQDPIRGQAGICDVRIESASAVLWERKGLDAATGAVRFAVSLGTAERFQLVTDFGSRAEVGDFVNWADISLVCSTK